jgi:uncharacterized repeat protein (TIGR03803 family)
MKRIGNALGKLNWGRARAAFVLCLATAIALPAQTFTTLWNFGPYPGGAQPTAGLVQATNGDLYGTTGVGGANGNGTAFQITTSGTLTTLYNFCSQGGTTCTDGSGVDGGVIQATNGDFYGTTAGGGAFGGGTVFKMTPTGTPTTLYSFCSLANCADGSMPIARLVQATNGDFYGTTSSGGANGYLYFGTVFKITPTGELTTLYSFCSQTNCADGMYPAAGLIQATNGDLYGTTAYATNGLATGTVFKITPSGTLTTLYSFCPSESNCTDGREPIAGLVQAANGDLYGTTQLGGTSSYCSANDGCGTVFRLTPSGRLTRLHSFCSHINCTDGYWPVAGLVQATDGNFYGTTPFGGNIDLGSCGADGCGTIFKISPGGALTTLYSFCSQINCTDGANPNAVLVQDTNGILYGTTPQSGAIGDGTVFSLSVGLGLFVETQTTSGKVGAAVRILGTNLKGATSVAFNGTAATFTVNSASEITATVPSGATTGTVEVVTSGGTTLSSNVPFRVP